MFNFIKVSNQEEYLISKKLQYINTHHPLNSTKLINDKKHFQN